MAALVVLFNLKDEASMEAYEQWAKSTDVPTVKNLNSVDDFRLYKLQAIMGADGKPPFQYCELIDVNNMELLGQEVAGEIMQRVAAEFQDFADNPIFMISDQIA